MSTKYLKAALPAQKTNTIPLDFIANGCCVCEDHNINQFLNGNIDHSFQSEWNKKNTYNSTSAQFINQNEDDEEEDDDDYEDDDYEEEDEDEDEDDDYDEDDEDDDDDDYDDDEEEEDDKNN